MTTGNTYVSPNSPGSSPGGAHPDLSREGNVPPVEMDLKQMFRHVAKTAPKGRPARDLIEAAKSSTPGTGAFVASEFARRMEQSFACLQLASTADAAAVQTRLEQLLAVVDPSKAPGHLQAILRSDCERAQAILGAAAADLLPDEHRSYFKFLLSKTRSAGQPEITGWHPDDGIEPGGALPAWTSPPQAGSGAAPVDASVSEETQQSAAQAAQSQQASLAASQRGVGVVETDRQRLGLWKYLKNWCIHHSKNSGEMKWVFGVGGLAAAGITSQLIFGGAVKLAEMSGFNELIGYVRVICPSIAVCAGLYIGAKIWKRGAAQIKAIIQHRLAGVIRLAQQGWEDPQGIMLLLKEGRDEFAKELGITKGMEALDKILKDSRKVQLTTKAKELLEVEETPAGLVYTKGTNAQGDKAKVSFREEELDTAEKLIPVLLTKGVIRVREGARGIYEDLRDGSVLGQTELIQARDVGKEYRAKLDQIFASDKVYRVQGTWDPLKLGFHDWDLSERCRQYCTAVLTLHEFSGQYKTDSKLTKGQIRSLVINELTGVPLQSYKDDATGYVVGNLIKQVYVRKHVFWAAFEGLWDRTLLSEKPGRAATAGGFIVFAPLVLSVIPTSISAIGGKVVVGGAEFMMNSGPLWIAIGGVALGSAVGVGAYVRRVLKRR